MLLLLAVLLVSELAHTDSNHHLNSVVVLVDSMLLHSVELLVDMVDHHPTNHHHSHLVVVLVDSMLLHSVVQLVEQAIKPRPHKSNNMLPMLKVSSKILTHKSSANPLLVVFKLIPKTSKFDSFNHHLSHPQA